MLLVHLLLLLLEHLVMADRTNTEQKLTNFRIRVTNDSVC